MTKTNQCLLEHSWRNPKEQRPRAVQRDHIREIKAVVDNPDAEPVMPCEAAKTAISSGPVSRVWNLTSNGLPLDQPLQ